MFGHKKNTDIDEFERREQLRKTYRIPAEQTLAELGEGRGASFFCWRQMAIRWTRTHEVANPVTQVSMAPDMPRDGRRESRRHTVSRFPQRLRHHEHGFVRYLSCAVPQFSVSLCKTTTTSFLISVDAVQLADMATSTNEDSIFCSTSKKYYTGHRPATISENRYSTPS